MKNKKLIAIILVVISVITLGACTFGGKSGSTVNTFDRPNITDNVTYYGCPNSKRVKKLNLKKLILKK